MGAPEDRIEGGSGSGMGYERRKRKGGKWKGESGVNFATMLNISQSNEGLKTHCMCPNPTVYLRPYTCTDLRMLMLIDRFSKTFTLRSVTESENGSINLNEEAC